MSTLEQQMDQLGLQNADDLDIEDSVFNPAQQVANEQAEDDAAEEAASDTSPDDMTCAICLERTPLTDIALVKGCEHQYCVNCILQWALCKEWCPQCKKPFDYLLCHRQLDGTLSDFLVEESVVLLKRARWFEDHLRERAKGKDAMPSLLAGSSSSAAAAAYAAAGADADTDAEHRDWADFYEDYLDAELEEDEEIEQYYFSSAAGRARVVLGNRRWGEGGYMRAGRMYARPVHNNNVRTPNAAGGKAAAGKAPAGSSPGAGSSRAAGAGAGGAGSSSSERAGGGSSSAAAAAAATPYNSASTSSSSAATAIGGASSSSSGGRGRTAAAWLEQDDDDDDFDYDDDFPYAMGGSGGSDTGNRRSGSSSSGSRSRTRPDRPAGMVKPIRQVPKNSPVCSMASGPLVSPLGKSPGGSGFQVGSWGACGSAGSTPGSGRRAKRNARRAAVDAAGGDDADYD